MFVPPNFFDPIIIFSARGYCRGRVLYKLRHSPATSVINSPWCVAAKRIAPAAGTLHCTP